MKIKLLKKVKKKYLNLESGFIRFNRFEINWSIYDIALPLSIDWSTSVFSFRVLFVSFYFGNHI